MPKPYSHASPFPLPPLPRSFFPDLLDSLFFPLPPSMEDSTSCCFLLYKAALVLGLIRRALSWAFKRRSRRRSLASSAPSSSKLSVEMIRQNLALDTYGEIMDRSRPGPNTGALCLSPLRASNEVRELRNCSMSSTESASTGGSVWTVHSIT